VSPPAVVTTLAAADMPGEIAQPNESSWRESAEDPELIRERLLLIHCARTGVRPGLGLGARAVALSSGGAPAAIGT
jgi:hypothetical protein